MRRFDLLLLLLGSVATVTSATCYKVVSEVGYIPDLEYPPCTAAQQTGCNPFYVCPPGSECKIALSGLKPCTNGTGVSPLMEY